MSSHTRKFRHFRISYLLTEDMQPGLGRGDRDCTVRVVGGGKEDTIQPRGAAGPVRRHQRLEVQIDAG
jgi:hypothetical protein